MAVISAGIAETLSSREIPIQTIPNPIRAVLFDLDGTLVDAFADIAAAANHVRKGLGFQRLSVDEVKQHVGHGARQLVAGVTGFQMGTPELEREFENLLKFYEDHPASEAVPFPGVLDLLDRLPRAGVKMGICTNKPHSVTVGLLDSLQLSDFFGSIIGEQPGIPPKPDPAMVYQGMEQLGVSAADTLFVGDSPVDMEVARQAGLAVVALSHGAHSAEELTALGLGTVVPDVAALLDLLTPNLPGA